MTTRADLENDLKFRIGNDPDVAAQLTLAIRYAYTELTTSIRIPETQESAVITLDTANGLTTYASPLDLFAPVSLRNQTDGKPLTQRSIQWYDIQRDTTTTGMPTSYVWWRNELIIQPPNDSTARTLLLRYQKRLPDLTASTSVSALPAEWDEVIVQGGLVRMQGWMGLKQEAQIEQLNYTAMIQRRLDRLREGAYAREMTSEVETAPRTI